jgi:NADH-ubiquinone oxidoreductase chain 5
MAIAAPTPISALVHSSTLVTAGLFLIIRFSYIIYSNALLVNILLVLCVFTSFYAGINSLFEMDLKKLIALSTLSHLGFIGIALFRGLLYLAFFHLLIHAFFKSLLFMAIGDVITNLLHSQDARFLSGGGVYTPFSFYIIILSFMNLLGLPSIRGFFSKDFILEALNYSNFSFIVVFVVYLNLFFTYYYTYKLFSFGFGDIKVTPFLLVHGPTFLHVFSLVFLGVLSVVFGCLWVNYRFNMFIVISVPTRLKVLPILLNFSVFLFLLFFTGLFFPRSVGFANFFSRMIFLSRVAITLSSNFFLKFSFEFSKSLESGVIDNFLNNRTSVALIFSARYLFGSVGVSVIFMVMISLCFMFIYFTCLSSIIN